MHCLYLLPQARTLSWIIFPRSLSSKSVAWRLTLFRMGFFGTAHQCGVLGDLAKSCPFSKICRTYPTTMKLATVIPYLRKIQKIYKSRDMSLELCWHQDFFIRNQKILLYQEIQISFWYIIFNSFKFFWVFQGCLSKYDNSFDNVNRNAYARPS